MKILSIETSCDETAISILDFTSKNSFKVLSDSILSQIEIHKQYGGVFPAVAKREHTNNIFPLLLGSLKTAGLLQLRRSLKPLSSEKKEALQKILDRDEHNLENILHLIEKYEVPQINAVAVTYGPGLEIALWTGFNVARALAEIWDIELIPVNHMEGHIFSSLVREDGENFSILTPSFPAISLLISGGHTDLVLILSEGQYNIIGSTLDDAVGEAYDKTARLIGIDYPGGPEISKLAEQFQSDSKNLELPRPMLQKDNFDFSFSGLKTAVLYLTEKEENITEDFKKELAAEFEDAVSEVLTKKTKKAIKKYAAASLIIGGGVSANNRLRSEFSKFEQTNNTPDIARPKFSVFLPNKKYTGDNALMIAVAGYYRYKNNTYPKNIKKVDGNLKLK